MLLYLSEKLVSSIANQTTAFIMNTSRFILKLDRNMEHVFYFLKVKHKW